jgi:nucleoside-diphosphate-sugar epimerase
LVTGADAIVHCAGAVCGASKKHFQSVNVDGVARLVEASKKQHPAPRFLLISSLAAREPHLSPYAWSKRRGEEILAESAKKMRWAALRPSAVYGPGDRELLPLFRWMRRGVAPKPGSYPCRFSLLYVEDLAEAVLQWLERGTRTGQAFEVHDGRPNGYTWDDVIHTIGRSREKKILAVEVPVPIVRLAASLNLAAARILGYAPMLTPWKVRELIHPNWVCSNEALTRDTGWIPQVSLEEGLRRTLDQGDGYLNGQNDITGGVM